MAKLTPAERFRLAKREPAAAAPGSAARSPRKFPPIPPGNWPHLARYDSLEELRAAMEEHGPADFNADTPWWRLCDYCEASGVVAFQPAMWACTECNLAVCLQHFEFMILETDETFDRRFAQ